MKYFIIILFIFVLSCTVDTPDEIVRKEYEYEKAQKEYLKADSLFTAMPKRLALMQSPVIVISVAPRKDVGWFTKVPSTYQVFYVKDGTGGIYRFEEETDFKVGDQLK